MVSRLRCRDLDCPQGHRLAQFGERVTCPTCRRWLTHPLAHPLCPNPGMHGPHGFWWTSGDEESHWVNCSGERGVS